MKKYLFDRIRVYADKVEFETFRVPTNVERMGYFFNLDFASKGDRWKISPNNFNDCIHMLKKTKLADNEYNIVVKLQRDEPIDFETFIKAFAGQQYAVKAPNEQVISEFYNRAYQIREEARRDKKLLEREPSSYIGGNATEQDSVEPETERE